MTGQGCTQDSLCVAKSCNQATKTCRPGVTEACTPSGGCGVDPSSPQSPVVCAEDTQSGKLVPNSFHCIDVVLGPGVGTHCDPCTSSGDCASGFACYMGNCIDSSALPSPQGQCVCYSPC